MKSLKSEEIMWNTQIRMQAGVETKDWTITEYSIHKHLICSAKIKACRSSKRKFQREFLT